MRYARDWLKTPDVPALFLTLKPIPWTVPEPSRLRLGRLFAVVEEVALPACREA
jgi:hypothetical protein